MTRAEIYRRAAEQIDCGKETFTCNAIIRTQSSHEGWRMRFSYSDMFASFIGRHGNTFLSAADAGEKWGKSGRVRVLALCFAAAMAETGDL